MNARVLILSALLFSGCNVFLSLDSLSEDEPPATTSNTPGETCTGDCSCSGTCDVDCSGCVVECNDGSRCSGTVATDSRVVCQGDARCEVGCTDGECEYACRSRGAVCLVDCGAGAECLLDCGDNRNPPQQNNCVFTSCDEPTECGGGIFVCNRACP